MSFCTQCGKEVSADASFCGHCGAPVRVSSSVKASKSAGSVPAAAGSAPAGSAPAGSAPAAAASAASAASATAAAAPAAAAKAAAAGGGKMKAIIIVVVVFALAFGISNFMSSGGSSVVSSTGSSGEGTADNELAAIETILNRDMNAMIVGDDLPSECADLTIDLFRELPSSVQSATLNASGFSESELKSQVADRYESLGYDSSVQATLSTYQSVDMSLSLGEEVSSSEIEAIEAVLSNAGLDLDIDRGYNIDFSAAYGDGSSNFDSLDMYIVKIDNTWYLMFDSGTTESMLVDGVIDSKLI